MTDALNEKGDAEVQNPTIPYLYTVRYGRVPRPYLDSTVSRQLISVAYRTVVRENRSQGQEPEPGARN